MDGEFNLRVSSRGSHKYIGEMNAINTVIYFEPKKITLIFGFRKLKNIICLIQGWEIIVTYSLSLL